MLGKGNIYFFMYKKNVAVGECKGVNDSSRATEANGLPGRGLAFHLRSKTKWIKFDRGSVV